MYIDKLIKKEIITLLVSVSLLVVIFIGVTYAKFLSVDNSSDTVINVGDLSIDFCNDSNCDSTYSNIGQVIGTKVENGNTVPAGIYPYGDSIEYSNHTPYIFKVTNTGSLDSTVKIKLKEDASFTPTGDYSSYTRLTSKYADHLKVAISKRVLYEDTGYQLGDVNMDGFVNENDSTYITQYVVGSVKFTDLELQKKLADTSEDGEIAVNDAQIIINSVLGKGNYLPTKFYINNYTSLEDGVIYDNDIIKAGEEAIYFVWLYLDNETPNDVQETYFAGNIDVVGEYIPESDGAVSCTYDGTLTQGATFTKGPFTYRYKQQGGALDWANIDTDGWGVILTDKTSTSAVTTDELCSSINGKPIVSTSYMFYKSQASSIDVSKLNAKNVINMASMFYNSAASTINIGKMDASNVVNMNNMFRGTSNLKSLDLSNFTTDKLTNAEYMFSDCKATTLNINGLNTSNVTNMRFMFYGTSATKLNLNSLDTSKVTTMARMFSNIALTSLNISNFDTSKVTDMGYMFNGSSSLKTVYVGSKWSTSAVTSSTNMFTNCSKIVGGNGTAYSSSKVDKTYAVIDTSSTPGYFTDGSDVIPEPESFSTDSWETIITAVRNNNTSKYKVGDTKKIDLSTYGTHTIRIANMSSPSECSNSNYSKTACGFVIEFADIIYNENISVTECGGDEKWIDSEVRKYLNDSFYNSLPGNLRSGIIDTSVISGHGSDEDSNDTTTDKIYLLSSGEVWGSGSSSNMNDSLNKLSSDVNSKYKVEKMVMCSPEVAEAISPILGSSDINVTRQLDYYKSKNVSITNTYNATKKYGDLNSKWWLRTPLNTSKTYFYYVSEKGVYGADHNFNEFGISPAFRIG